jgi:hypothetical protein
MHPIQSAQSITLCSRHASTHRYEGSRGGPIRERLLGVLAEVEQVPATSNG